MCTKIYCVDRYKVLPQGVILESLNHTAAVVDVVVVVVWFTQENASYEL